MINSYLDGLPWLKQFKDLKRGDRVYSKQYGIGEVHSLYNKDEVIIQFNTLRKRLSIVDGVSRIPQEYIESQTPRSMKVEVVCDGKNMSFAEFKRQKKAERARQRAQKKLLG